MDRQGNLIFVSIAAYRDPQLVPTVLDCIAKADQPERLRFGICWQHGDEETSLPFVEDSRFRILDIHWQDSRGACWARAEVMKLWQREDWFLQVDSHCRFVRQWDSRLLQAASQTGSEKPILSTYATPFTPAPHEVLSGGPLQIAFQGFTPEGIPKLKPESFPRSLTLDRPVRARFLSAGFLFAPGRFVEEVPYDPGLYFMGEEIAMTVRAFTQGYDLFHPAETVIWHDYLRLDAKKHWGDHTEAANPQLPWGKLDETSRLKVARLLRGESIEPFGLGHTRSLADYEAYAGLSFRRKKAQRYTVSAEVPPNPDAPPNWTENIYPWIVRVNIMRSELPQASFEDPTLWYLGITDETGTEIHRMDVQAEKLAAIDQSAEQLSFICEFHSESIPAAWTIWPLSRSKGWLKKCEGKLHNADFAILLDDDVV